MMPEETMPEEAQSTESVQGETISLGNSRIQSVEGTSVQLNQCGVIDIHAENAEIHDSGMRHVVGQQISVTDSLMLVMQAGSAEVTDSAIGLLKAQELTVNSPIGLAIGQNIQVNQTRAGILAANEIHGEKIESFVVLASQVNGSIETKIGPRGLALIGVTAGLTLGLVVSLVNVLRSRR